MQGKKAGDKRGWRKDDPESSDKLRRFLDGGKETRFKQKYPAPGVGDRFGEYTVTRLETKGERKGAVCRCSCGVEKFVDLANLRLGKATRCGKCGRQRASKTWVKIYSKYAHIMPDQEHRRRLVNRLRAAITRCHSPNAGGFENYGGRGITVCDEWRGPDGAGRFLTHVITLDGWDVPSFEMDRIDTNEGYKPGNIRFVTRAKNMLNKRSIAGMQKRIDELENCLRHCKCGAFASIHDQNQ